RVTYIFFQAEDGIRDGHVTGVQTCALPICASSYCAEVKIQEQVFSLLSAQYEEARITEARDVSTVEVLDRADPPDRRFWPRRGLLTALGFVISAFGALLWIAWSVRRSGAG